MTAESTDHIRLDTGDHVAVITLNRPEKRNAITPAMAEALDAAVKKTESDDDIRVVVLASSGDVFCAGADLREVAEGNALKMRTADGGFAGMVFAKHSKPWIAAVSGPALAGGAELVLACDMAIGVPEAKIGLPEVTRGLIAGAGGIFRLPRLIPRNVALQLIATGDPLSAERALQFGLFNLIVPRERLMDEALKLARTIAGNAPVAVRESLEIARRAAELTDEELRRMAGQSVERVIATEDSKEGARAFVEKRAPVWQGR